MGVDASPDRGLRLASAPFIGGSVGMGLEILAGRVLAPAFGQTAYTWGAILGVFMLALSLGYFWGGRRAESKASRQSIGRLFVTAAFLFVLAMLFQDGLLSFFDRLALLPRRYNALLPLLVLFAPPVFFLGQVSPYVAELSKGDGYGEVSGRVYAIGTVGSIVGAFATTFVLIPALTIFWNGVLFVLTLLGAALFVGNTADRKTLVRGGLVVIVLLVALNGYNQQRSPLGQNSQQSSPVLYETNTQYQHIEVRQHGSNRYLYSNGHPQSGINLSTDDPVYEYIPYMQTPLLHNESAVEKVLVIGGGGYVIPHTYATHYDASVDVVEIDPGMVTASNEYFYPTNTSRIDTHVMDGRRYLQQTNETYDVILVDAYRKDLIPYHLTTVEFYQLTREHLRSDGVVAINVISPFTGEDSKLHRAETKTMHQVYPSVHSYHTESDPGAIQNVILVGTANGPVNESQLRARYRTRSIEANLTEALTHHHSRSEIDTSSVDVVSDDDGSIKSLTDPLVGRDPVVDSAPDSGRNATNTTATTTD
jgi:spermidine synthase